MKQRKITIGKNSLQAEIKRNTFNPESRTVEVVWTTGARVKRFSWTRGEYYEELSLKRGDVNLDRLKAGAPVLNNHRAERLEDQIGVVESAQVRGGVGYATLRLSDREELQGLVRDIENGIIKNISVGYSVQTYQEVSKKGDDVPTYRAIDWTPMELSFVNIPADKDSQVRSEDQEKYEVEIVRTQEDDMNEEQLKALLVLARSLKVKDMTGLEERLKTEEKSQEDWETEIRSLEIETPAEPKADPVVEPATEDLEARKAELLAEGRKIEMKRQDEIRNLVTSVGLENDLAEKLIKEEKTTEEARSAVIKALQEKQNEKPTTQSVEVTDVNNKNLRKAACENAIAHIYGEGKSKPELIDGARQFASDDIISIARNFMEAEGHNVRNMSKMDIVGAAIGKRNHVSSDFPLLLADVTNKSLQRAYAERPQTFAPFTTSRTVADFKTIQSTQFGDAPKLEKVNEKGEYREGTISEGKESYKIEKFGKMLSVSEELLINDDLGAFLRLAEKMGRRARDLESDTVWGQITSNPVMGDGVTLFNNSHGNIASGVINVDNVGAARAKMRAQLGLDGAKLDLMPVYIVVPSALETKVQQFLGTTTPDQDGNVNPFKGRLSEISEIRLDDKSTAEWYLFADASQLEMIEIARLRGQESPSIETMMAFETDAMKIKIKYHFAAKVLDWRGFVRSTGA